MSTQSISDVLAANRQVLRQELGEIYESGDTTYNMIKKGVESNKISKTVEGKDFRIPLEINPPGDFAAFSLANGALGQGSGFTIQQMYQTYFALRMAVSVDQDTILATQTNEQSVVNALKRNTKKALPHMLRMCNASFFNQGGAQGLVALATGYASGTTTYTFDPEFAANHLENNMKVQIHSNDLATHKTTGVAVESLPYFTQVDKEAGTAKINGLGSVTPAADDYFAFPGAGDTPAWMNTLRYFHTTATSGNLLGLSLATYPEIRPNKYNASGNELSPEGGDILKERMRQRRGSISKKMAGIIHGAQVGAAKKLNMALMRQDRTPGAVTELVDIMPNTPDEVMLWGIKHKIDIHQSKKQIDWLSLDKWGRVYAQEIDWWKNPNTGNYLFENRTTGGGLTAGWSFFLYVVENFYNVDLGWDGFQYGLAIPSGY